MDIPTASHGSTAIQYSDAYTDGPGAYSLVELPNDILDAVRQNEGVSFVAEDGDSLVLCTTSGTYAMRLVESSNTSLLVDLPSQERSADGAYTAAAPVVASISHTFEVVPATARLHKLRYLLRDFMWGEEDERDAMRTEPAAVLSLDELRARVQASEAELRAELKRLGAVQIDNAVRLIAPGLALDILRQILLLIVENDWRTDSFPLDDVTNAVGARLEVVRGVVERVGSVSVGEGQPVGALNRELAIRIFAEYVLVQQGESDMQVAEFLQKVRDLTLDLWDIDEKCLLGIGFITQAGAEKLVKYVPADALPEKPDGMLRSLFSMRAQWTKEELLAYLARAELTGETIDAVILRLCRPVSGPEGKEYLVSRTV